MARVALIDPFSGASGDMFLGALLDLGVAEDVLRRGIAGLDLDPHALRIDRISQHGVAGTRCAVEVEIEVHDRRWREIRDLIAGAALPDRVKERALTVFTTLAEAEAAVHGVSVDDVHFHEVGGTDAIIDIVGTCIGLEALGIEQMHTMPVQVGSGFVRAAHGVLPVPAPATARILADAGVPIAMPSPLHAEHPGELLTPTGAAIIAALTEPGRPALTPQGVGYGFGSRELPWPNALRIWIGDAEGAIAEDGDDGEVQIETNIDDMNPQFTAMLLDRLFAAGAVDAWVTPIMMKKGRPAFTVSAICAEAVREAVSAVFIEQSTTLGVRVHQIERTKADRRFVTVTTRWGDVALKLRGWRGRVIDATPEYEDCAALAANNEVPVRDVWNEAHRFGEVFVGQRWDAAPGDRVTAMRQRS